MPVSQAKLHGASSIRPLGHDEASGRGMHVTGLMQASPGRYPGADRLGEFADVGEREEWGAARMRSAIRQHALSFSRQDLGLTA